MFARICVFCGSKLGRDARFRAAAAEMGTLLADRGVELVYGGGSVGLMGVVADAALAAAGRVTGILPEILATKELLHPSITTTHIVPSMHARKAKMAELADAFIALPGGFGTFEELLEIITWCQLGIHRKPIGLLNIAGYFDALLNMIDHAIAEGFIKSKWRSLLAIADQPTDLLRMLEVWDLPVSESLLKLDDA